MNLRELQFGYTYDTSVSGVDVVSEFLEPCLGVSKTYDRLSGYFSSRFLAMAAIGLGKFLSGDGKMRLVMSSQVSPSDFGFLEKSLNSGNDYSDMFSHVVGDAELIADAIERNHFEAMCWLLATGRLEIRLSIYKGASENAGDPIFHPKIGIFADADGNKVSFSGSVNETIRGWTGNVEEFKVFRSWEVGSAGYFEHDQVTFDRHWENKSQSDFITVPLPSAIKEKLISIAPEDTPLLTRAPRANPNEAKPIKYRNYQLEARKSWVDAGYKGILAMATGTGKTKTAKICIEAVLKIGPSIVVITAPFEHIAAQWLEELKEYSPIMASSSNSNWRKDLAASATSRKLNWINNLIVVAVQKTASSPKFSIEIDKLIPLFSESLFVGDEVHGLGASSYRSAMNDSYNFRLGLSATPERYFDEIGSAAVMTYFEGIVYEFDTKAALAWRDPITGQPALANYKYHPQFVSLNDQEAIEYEELTAQIGAAMGVAGEGQMSSALEKLLFARAAVIKKAASKVPALERIIDELDRNIDYSLIYCHDNEQLLQVAELLLSKGISYQKITGEEDVTPSAKYHGNSERAWILEHFTNGTTKVLLAIRCLDEGVDIPDARLAFILASSGNPREFIQRRGRLLRPGINKEFATIYDFVVAPNIQDSKKIGIEKSVFLKELKRIREFAEDSLNSDQVGTKVATMMLEMEKM